MLNWSEWRGDGAEWDGLLLQFSDHCVYQSHGWGAHKSHFGWTVLRLLATERGEVVAMAQAMVRKFPAGIAMAWVNGGPVGRVDVWGNSLRNSIAKAAGSRLLYCRINPMREHAVFDAGDLAAAGWSRSTHPLLSGQSILLDVKMDENDWLKSIGGKHRYYVKKAFRAEIQWDFGNTTALRRDMSVLSRKLSAEKAMNIPEWDEQALEDLSRSMLDSLHILVGYLGGVPVTGCLVLVLGRTGLYRSAATLQGGREVSAAYAMLARLRSLLRKQHVDVLDFGGIDPASDSARGVNHFKRGFGGREIEYLGEWDWGIHWPVRQLANVLIKRRAGAM